MANIKLNNNEYPIPDSVLATHTADFIAHLGTIAGNGLKVVIGGVEYGIDASKVAGAVSGLEIVFNDLKGDDPQLAPGLYQTGAIALFREGNIEDASAMMTTSWEDLEASGAIAISEGEEIELPDMNEYGFYFGVPYSVTAYGATVALTFNKDGSAIMSQNGVIQEMPAGTIVYGDHSVDMSAVGLPTFVVSADGTSMEAEGLTFTVGSSLPPKGTVYLGTVNGELPVFEGDLVLPNDGRATTIMSDLFRNQYYLTNMVIPDSVTSIGDYAFYNCQRLTGITIGNGVTSIGQQAFRKCKALTSLTLGNGVISIGDDAFSECYDLKKINYTGTAENWCNILFSNEDSHPMNYDTELYLNNVSVTQVTEVKIPDTSTKINNYIFRYWTGLISIIIPDGVTSIGDYAFNNCESLTDITIPNSVTSIGHSAFNGCTSLTSVTIPDSVTSIGHSAFNGCTSLTSVTIPDSVTSIGDYTFSNCESLTDITIPDSVTSIGDYAFNRCKNLTNFTIPNSVTSIGHSAFYGCTSLTSVTIPDSVTSIGNYAFHGCTGLESITIPNSVTSIGDSAFYRCENLKGVYITDLETWCKIAFYDLISNPMCYSVDLYLNNELVIELTIPNSVISISDYTFYKCKNFTSVTIPNSVTSIGNYAFRECTGLTSMIFKGTMAEWNNITKGNWWNDDVPATYVQCSDGQVTL